MKTLDIKSVSITEVGPRDGLQNEAQSISTAAKLEFIQDLVEANIRQIEVTSFVSPQRIPQMKDSFELYSQIPKKADVRYIALVPNTQGMERALQVGVDAIAVFTAGSESFTQKNIRCSIEESFERFDEVLKLARQHQVWVRGYISTAFVCPYEGPISPHKVLEIAQRLLDVGAEELSLGDTIGFATPTQVEALLEVLDQKIPFEKIFLHFHDTRGMALANVLRSLQLGIRNFDSSAGGLGGCPYAPGASGNLATEDLLNMLHDMGIETGIDLNKVILASKKMEKILQKKLPSKVLQAINPDCARLN